MFGYFIKAPRNDLLQKNWLTIPKVQILNFTRKLSDFMQTNLLLFSLKSSETHCFSVRIEVA